MAIKKEIQTSVEDTYIIDIERFDREGLSFKFLIIDKFFEKKSENLMNLKEKEIFEKILLLEKELDIKENPETNLLKQFVLPGTSLIEAIFRILVLNKNQPMTITEMETNLREAWASVIYLKSYSHDTIARMLNATNEYFIKKTED
jgi:hypothetical protein|tara:strand:- start:133 stop:570 length:438 start_codon:yes stop_codon:yes gene_type:complete